jgi:hypothetical protein
MKYKASIVVGVVEAKNLQEAKAKILAELENYAGSNDGSELLANANPIIERTDKTAEFNRFAGLTFGK